MNKENIKKIQKNLEKITRKWWFFLIILLIQFIPPITQKPYDLSKFIEVIYFILGNSFNSSLELYSLDLLLFFLIIRIIPHLIFVSIIFFGDRANRLFTIYVSISYILIAFAQLIAITEEYGISIITNLFIVFILISISWFWELGVRKNDFTPQKRSIWKYWVVPLAFFAYWLPIDMNTLLPDFNPLYLLVSISSLTFCMMTPLFLTVLILYFPKVNLVTLRTTSFIAIIIALYNIVPDFLINPSSLWWMGVLHLPLLIISIYGFALSFKKSQLEVK